MNHFHSAREAKEFLVSRIVQEAQRENVLLSEVERKMLYFSETDWTLPDIMQVNDQFDREYNQSEYEKKITQLVSSAARYDRKQSGDQYDTWLEAIRCLEKEDHYILVMVRGAHLRPRGDQMKLLLAGVSVAIILVGSAFLSGFLSDRYGSTFGRYLPPGSSRIFYYGVIGVIAVIAYRMGWLTR